METRTLTVGSLAHWFWCSAVLTISVASFQVQPGLVTALTTHPLFWIFPVVATAGLFGVVVCQRARLSAAAFLSSAIFLAGTLCSAALGLFTAAPASNGIGLLWWLPAFLVGLGYAVCSYRRLREPGQTRPVAL